MSRFPVFALLAAVVVVSLVGESSAQFPMAPRGESENEKKTRQMVEEAGKLVLPEQPKFEFPGMKLPKHGDPPLIPKPGEFKTPAFAPQSPPPSLNYQPRSRAVATKPAPPPASTVAPPMAQPALAERKPSPPPAPAKPPCVYKPVMSDDDIAACR